MSQVTPGGPLLRRLWARLRGDGRATLDPDRDDLEVVASGFDDAEACSTALERASSWIAEYPVVLRHVLALPAEVVADAEATVAQDGYRLVPSEVIADLDPPAAAPAGQRVVAFERVQMLDALHCSQERSRMAGLAQRRDGVVLGWLALQPRA